MKPQWYDKSAGDRQTVRELLPTDEQGNPLGDRTGTITLFFPWVTRKSFWFLEVTYVVHVFTGDKSGAGTDANVFLTIYGQHEDSGKEWNWI